MGKETASDWVLVASKKKERSNSARTSAEVTLNLKTPKTASPRAARPPSNLLRGRILRQPLLPTASILRQKSLSLLDQSYNKIRDLALRPSTEVVDFVYLHWEPFKMLLKNERFHEETASFVQTMAAMSAFHEIESVEFIILMVLMRIKVRALPQNCRGVKFFSALCRIFHSIAKRGSQEAKMFIHGRRWVLDLIELATNYLSCVEAEAILGQLQEIDGELSRSAQAVEQGNHTAETSAPSSGKELRLQTSKSSHKVDHNGNVGSTASNETGVKKRVGASDLQASTSKTRGIPSSKAFHGNITGLQRNNGPEANNDWQTVKRNGKKSKNHLSAFAPPRYLPEPSRVLKPAHQTKQKPTAARDNVPQKKAILAGLKNYWPPQDLPSHLEKAMMLVSAEGRHPNSKDFISELCRSPLVENMWEFLNLKRGIAVPPRVLQEITRFCSTVSRTCPDLFFNNFGGIVDMTFQAVEEFGASSHVQREILKLRGTFVNTTYVSDPANTPQESFRDMFVAPTAEDFQQKEVFLRPNVTTGPYSCEDHYLDVQFRLLREDFLKPLRDGIAEIRGRAKAFDRSEENRFNGMRIYKNVTFQPKSSNSNGIKMSFDPCRQMNIDWRISKRFMIGALLVVSNDNFITLHVLRVVRRDLESLSAGWLLAEPLWPDDPARALFRGSFVVGESMVFFQPYLHVLTALQNINTDTFPLARYIVHANPADELPDYLQVEQNRRFKISLGAGGGDRELDIVNGSRPSPGEMGLNESQHEAMFRALTQKVMLVQGPPGTGKTFLGLRIVSTLLQNPHAWRGTGDSASPILIVCYTNHALDQFLVGLLSTTKSIVRLGGRCKDERLADFMLKKNEDDLSRDLKRLKWERHRERDEAELDLECVQAAARALNDNVGIVSWQTLLAYQVVPADLPGVPEDFSILSWLEKGITGVQLSDDVKEFLRQNPKWSNKCFEFEDTFSNILSSIDELQQLSRQNPMYGSALEYYKAKLQYLGYVFSNQVSEAAPETQVTNILDLDPQHRPQLYRHWVSQLKVALAQAERLTVKYRGDCASRIRQVRMLKDKELIASHLVVGMTTTKAAEMQPLLQELRPGIVIVEEAAEVLESHIIAALTPHVQHLVLLGDHKQLRPSPADHEVGTNYKLEVSLFERLCNNNMPCKALNIQHRMRPEIASLIQFIYPGLENHSSVSKYPDVRGLASSMFFIDHQRPEQEMDELRSHCNPHEAEFLAALVTYLLHQGYDDSQITVLTAYAGQLMYLKGLESKYPDLRRVRVCNVDNFQGEESDIILLSLVRSNPQNNVGFLKTENRVCVALSRAKHGMIVVGNLKSLTASSEAWRKVETGLQSQGAVGRALTLRCIKHPEQTLRVNCGADFERWTFGGCETRCDFVLRCRHNCPLACHRHKLDHQEIVCLEVCNKMVCNIDHPPYFCTKLCYDKCEPCNADKYVTLECRHMAKMKCWQNPATFKCTMDKTVKLKNCGHIAKMPCSRDPETYLCKKKEMRLLEGCGHENLIVCFRNGPCKFPCKAKLPCGHLCMRDCHKFDDPHHEKYQCNEPCRRTRPGCSAESKHPCTMKCRDACPDCDIRVTKPLPCHHNAFMPCSQPATQDRCKARCSRRRATCKHPCKNLCGQDCGDCETEVQKEHPVCKHKLTMPCHADPAAQVCTEPCEKPVLPCSHKCSKICGKSCLPCTEKVLKKLPDCDHSVLLACGASTEGVECQERCTKKLRCGHPCRARCAEPCQDKCSKPVPCSSPCGHSVKVPCSEKDLWCSADASLTLMSRCKKACGFKLVCGHQCKGTCSECYQGRFHRACDEKCTRVLVCGHSCEDQCGMPCLPCGAPCPVKCTHSKCSRQCGQRCSPCSKKCEMGKPTFKCDKKCREKCTWSPTQQPCWKPIKKCQHDCIGLQGDPCPSLCRTCDKDRAEFQNASPDDRFLELADCGHIVRFDVMEKAIKEKPHVVRLPSCPTCKVPVSNSGRYGNLLKKQQEHIEVIFKELSWNPTMMKEMNNALMKLQTLAGLAGSDRRTKQLSACAMSDSPKTYTLMTAVCEAMKAAQGGEQRDVLARKVRGLCTYADVLLMLDGCLRSFAKESSIRAKVAGQVDGLSAALQARLPSCCTLGAQEVMDLNAELLRIQRLYQLCVVENHAPADGLRSDADYLRVAEILRACGPYPWKTLDDTVGRTVGRLSDTQECNVDKQWWKELSLPRSSAEGCWYLCGKGHLYPKTEARRNCKKCYQVEIVEE